jgi:hypothetical protein
MHKYALIKNGVVENVFICDDDTTAQALFADDLVVNIDTVAAGIGWTYENEVFTNRNAPQPSNLSDLYEAELTAINDEYDANKLKLANEYLNASLFDGNNEPTKKAEIYSRLQSLNQKYASDLNSLDEKYGG